MDGMGNSKEHAKYLQSFLAIEHIDISTIVDLGFGLGQLFGDILKTFKPHTALGIEPSEYAFKRVKLEKIRPVPSTELQLLPIDLLSWCRIKSKQKFDLGICTSVFQYIPDRGLKEILPILAKRIKYLYLTVPTDVELKRQALEVDLDDQYALGRTRVKYKRLIQPHFTFISSRVLESKYFFDEESTFFSDQLFRF